MESIEIKTLAPLERLFILALSVLAVVLTLISISRYGPGLSPDSIVYIGAARHIAAGLGATSYNLTDFVDKPPFYPMVLAFFQVVLGIDPLVSAQVLNAFFLGLIVYISGVWFANHLSRALVWLVGAFVLFSPPLIDIATMVWSEPLFILFVLLYLVALERFLVRRDARAFIVLTTSAALACLTRYIGVALLPVGALAMVWRSDGRLISRVRAAIGSAVIATLPVGIWILRNIIITGTPFGPRPSSAFTITQNFDYTLGTIFSWYFLQPIFENRLILLGAGIAVGVVFARLADQRAFDVRRLGPIILFVVSYAAFLIFLSAAIAYDQLGSRLLSPLFVPVTLLVAVFIEKLAGLAALRFPTRPVRIVLLIGLTLWFLALPARTMLAETTRRVEQGMGGYLAPVWQTSPLIQRLKREPLQKDRLVYTNDPYALYFFVGLTGELRDSPFKRKHYNSYDFANDLATLKANWLAPGTRAYWVWFTAAEWEFLFKPAEVEEIVEMRQIFLAEDGAIFVVSPKP